MARPIDSDEIIEMMSTENDNPPMVFHGEVQTMRRQLRSMGVMHGHIRHAFLRQKRHTPHKLMEMSWRGAPWQAVVEDMDFVAHYTHESNPNGEEPTALWPIFDPKTQALEDLIAYCKYPWGEREDLFGKNNWATADLHPVPGQKHVVWTKSFMPKGAISAAEMAEWFSIFDELAEEYNVEFGLANTTSYKAAFSGSFRYVGVSLKHHTMNGTIVLPSGRTIRRPTKEEHIPQAAGVIRSMGFNPDDLFNDTEQVRLFNIASVQRAALTWKADGDAPRRRGKGFR